MDILLYLLAIVQVLEYNKSFQHIFVQYRIGYLKCMIQVFELALKQNSYHWYIFVHLSIGHH